MNSIREILSARKSFLDAFAVRLYRRLEAPNYDLCNKRAIVTGANVGLGKAIASSLAAQGAEVHLLCRDRSKADTAREEIVEQTGNSRVYVHQVDFSSLKSISGFVDDWGKRNRDDQILDILINNAGLSTGSKRTTADGFETTYAVNILGQFALTIPLLQRGYFTSDCRIVQISSMTMYQGRQSTTCPQDLNSADLIGDKQEGEELPLWQIFALYQRSKALQVVFTMELQERVEADPRYQDVVVQSCHPGNVITTIWSRKDGISQNPGNAKWADLINGRFGISPEEGAITPVWLATAPEPSHPRLRGKYWERNGWKWIPAWMNDPQQRHRMWNIMARDAGLEGVY